MNSRIRALVLAAAMIAAAVLYTARLNGVPTYLSSDETAFALQAHAIATTAHDENGRFMPLYFQMIQNVWFHPALVYCIATIFTVVRPMPWAARLPTVMIALGNLVLVFAVARRLGTSRAAAIGASVLLALTPAHLLHGRLACDYLLPVPCVLAWLILFMDARRFDSRWRFFAAGSALGLGLYTYIAAVALMPAYLLLTYLVLFLSGERRLRPYAAISAGFILLLLPLAIYLVAVPEVYAGFAARYSASKVDVVHDPRALFLGDVMAQRWATYRSFFEWSFLFERAETHPMSSTYTSGVFLKAMKVLIPLGAYHILRNRRTPFTLLLLASFLVAPLAASLVPEKYAIDRALLLLPTGALIGAFGLDWLLVPRIWFVTWAGRAVCAGLFVWMAVQFNGFYRDYLTGYRVRAAFWFDGNRPGAFEPIISQHAPGDRRFIYLSNALPRIREHWKLHLLSRGRIDLLARTVLFNQQDLSLAVVSPGSLLLTGVDDPVSRSFLKMAAVQVFARINEPDGSPVFTIFERTQANPVYRFDGTYAAQVSLTCAPGAAPGVCASLATTASCPSMEIITVANNVVLDSCGYLNQAVVTDDGLYMGASNDGIPVKGTFATTGTFRLSGTGASGGNEYQLTFLVTKRN